MPVRTVSRETSTPFGTVFHSNRSVGRCSCWPRSGGGSGPGGAGRDRLFVRRVSTSFAGSDTHSCQHLAAGLPRRAGLCGIGPRPGPKPMWSDSAETRALRLCRAPVSPRSLHASPCPRPCSPFVFLLNPTATPPVPEVSRETDKWGVCDVASVFGRFLEVLPWSGPTRARRLSRSDSPRSDSAPTLCFYALPVRLPPPTFLVRPSPRDRPMGAALPDHPVRVDPAVPNPTLPAKIPLWPSAAADHIWKDLPCGRDPGRHLPCFCDPRDANRSNRVDCARMIGATRAIGERSFT